MSTIPPHTLAEGRVAWQRFGKEYCLTGQYGSRPIFLSVTPKGRLMLRDAERDLLIPFDPSHPDAQRIVDCLNEHEALKTQIKECHQRCTDSFHLANERAIKVQEQEATITRFQDIVGDQAKERSDLEAKRWVLIHALRDIQLATPNEVAAIVDRALKEATLS